VHQFVLPDTFQTQLKALFGRGEIPENPSFYVFNPSLIDDTLAPSGHSVLYMLVPVPAGNHQVDWANVKQKLADQVICMAEQRLFPDLRNHIQWQKVRTPEDAEREGLYLGGSFGIAPTLGQSAVWRPQVKPVRQDGLYAVGASVHPGGGVPIVMQGAKLVADLISKE
jgi:phytoene desaturase